MKKIITILLFISVLFSEKSFAQIGISYYPFESVLSISSNTEKLFWGDLRLETNTFFSSINTEFDAMINIKRTDWINYYTGIGININPFYSSQGVDITNAYVLNAGVRIKPIQKHKNWQVIFELSPLVNKKFDVGKVRSLLGVAYNLSNKKE